MFNKTRKWPFVSKFSVRILIIVLLTMLWNEYFTYCLQHTTWPTTYKRDAILTILFVADAQIQGELKEPGGGFGSITRWDSDRFLKTSLEWVYYYMKPDVVVFLGDIMDEGSLATPEQYKRYLGRLNKIFEITKSSQVIYIPGDNDIGGEGNDIRTPFKEKRFVESFGSYTDVVTANLSNHQTVQFIKVDRTKSNLIEAISQEDKNLRIVISHQTVLPYMKTTVLTEIKPHMIFSADSHKSIHFKCVDCRNNGFIKRESLLNLKSFMTFNMTDPDIDELMVPTCSYRMGERHIGYGLALIDSKNMLHYTVLWSPSRMGCLYVYLFMFIVIIVIFLCKRCRR